MCMCQLILISTNFHQYQHACPTYSSANLHVCVICAISIGSFDDDAVEQLVKENLQMKNFQHRNVMGMLGVCLDAGPAPYLVLPYMKNGDLLSYLKSNREELVLSQDEPDDKVYTCV